MPDRHSHERGEGEVGVQSDTQDFRSSVQWVHHVADSHLRVERGLEGIRGEQCHAGFLVSNGQLLSICPLHQRRKKLVRPHLGLHDADYFPSAHFTKEEQSWFALTSASTMLGEEASNVKSLV